MALPSARLLIATSAIGFILLILGPRIMSWPISSDILSSDFWPMTLIGISLCFLLWSLVTFGWAMFQPRPGERLVTKGPYRYIRHPFTLGMMTGVMGLALAFNHWLSLLAVILILWPAYILRARREELDLAGQFGDEWTEYHSRTHFLIPGIW